MKNKDLSRTLGGFYEALFRSFGPQLWWPARTRFEVVVGAILTQNTNWTNVEKAIRNLRREKLLKPGAMHALGVKALAERIRPAGYFNVKAKRLKAFLSHLFDNYGGGIDAFLKKETGVLRRELLTVNGIGPETADSIVLYAAGKPVFVVDAYTKRVLTRHGLIGEDAAYDEMQKLFMDNLPHEAGTFNEYHALIVRVGKEFCRPREPLCTDCPLGGFL
ncbi:MAG: endonuclease III domain-containing protein [Thermodesulfobacteriota bacterium]